MASSQLPYVAYQGHRRGQSTAASVTSGNFNGAENEKSTRSDVVLSASASTSNSVQFDTNRPTISLSQPQPQASLKRIHSTTTSIRPAFTNASATTPPPLRTISSIRSHSSSSNFKANGKGKEVSNQAEVMRLGQASTRSPLSNSIPSSMEGRRSVSSSLIVPNSTSTPALAKDALERATSSSSVASLRSNGHSKRHSYSPSTGALNSSHLRNTSSNISTPHLPHVISTAQRLRSANNASDTPTTSLSNSSSPIGTPRVISPSIESMDANAGTSIPSSMFRDGIGRRTAYRPGFQPKGVHRVRTDEFLAARDRRKAGLPASQLGEDAQTRGELEAQRLERRLEKLVTLYYDSTSVSIDSMPSWLPNTLRKTRQLAEEERRIREEEMRIVKWEEDSTRKVCPICSIRKHHCRLCGRVICASPHLSSPQGLDAEKASSDIFEISISDDLKCSTLMISDRDKGAVLKDMPRWDSREGSNFDGLERSKRGIRICRDCRGIILHRQYMLDDGKIPAYLRLYEGLISLQKDIEQSLPEFQEMVLGLQKQDAAIALGTTNEEGGNNDILSLNRSNSANESSIAALKARNRNTLALQRDAAQARKQLVANFANYDLFAKKIRNLDDEGNASLERIKMAIWTKANLFLQQNMFPLQSLPKLTEKKEKKKSSSSGTHTPNSSGNISDADIRPMKGGMLNETISSADAKADARAKELVQTDPQAAKESLLVLEQQLSLVLEYAASASRARKFQDAKSLKTSAFELELEIARLRKYIHQ